MDLRVSHLEVRIKTGRQDNVPEKERKKKIAEKQIIKL